MGISSKKAVIIFLLAICLCLLLSAAVRAEDHERYYLRLQGVEADYTGDFTGRRAAYFVNDETIKVIAPELETANGYGLTFGGENGRLYGEVSYLTSKHDSKVGNYAFDFNDDDIPDTLFSEFNISETSVERISFDFKYALVDPAKFSIIPVVLLGISHDTFKVKNGAANIVVVQDDPATTPANEFSVSPPTHDTAKYWGFGYKLGVGLLFRLHDKVAVEGSYTFSRTNLDHVKAFKETRDPNYQVNSQLISVSLNYYF